MTAAGVGAHPTAPELDIIAKARTLTRAFGHAELSAWLRDNDLAGQAGPEGADSAMLYPAALGIAQHLISELLLIIDL